MCPVYRPLSITPTCRLAHHSTIMASSSQLDFLSEEQIKQVRSLEIWKEIRFLYSLPVQFHEDG